MKGGEEMMNSLFALSTAIMEKNGLIGGLLVNQFQLQIDYLYK